MGHSVEALLDADLEATVRAGWSALAAAGLPGVPAEGSGHRPHITLTYAARHDENDERLLPQLITSGHGLPLDVTLGGVLVFARYRSFVLCRAVVPSCDLLGLQERVAGLIGHNPGFAPTSAPGAWTPHVTLARLKRTDDVATALRVLTEGPEGGDGERPHRAADQLTGAIVAVRRWDGDARRAWTIAGDDPAEIAVAATPGG